MAETSHAHLPSASCDTTTESATSDTLLAQHQESLEPESKIASPIANRVCTPLGLFVHPSERDAPLSMPQTLTPESTPASPRRHERATASTSPIRQSGASPTRSRMAASDCMRKRNDSISDALRAAAANAHHRSDEAPSPLVPVGETQPLHTGTVLANTKMVHPKPINRVAPADVTSRPGTASSVAQLEMTAQQLSMTSSIDDAIRDLHGELKRSDSRRSSILAASIKTGDDGGTATPAQLKRHLSTSSSIVSTNIAARQGGYSPAAFVKSPSASGNGRLMPGTLTAASLPEAEPAPVLSRHGPGKSSVRSVRSTKMSLADISESEPISLTQTVLDEADNAPPLELESIIHEIEAHEEEHELKPTTEAFHEMMQSGATQQPAFSYSTERNIDTATISDRQNRPGSSHSQDTYHQAQHAFFDFDGVHCADNGTEADDQDYREEPIPTEAGYIAVDQHLEELEDDVFDLPPLQLPQTLPQAPRFSYGEQSLPPVPQPVGLVRPQSYIDPASGVQMNYYPARVPAALNVPQKLSNKPKANQRNSRQSKVLSAMMDNSYHASNGDAARRASAMPVLGSTVELAEAPRPLKERHHERRPSFLPLSTEDMQKINEPVPEPAKPPVPAQESCDNLASTLRIPKRISEPKVVEKRKSRMSMMSSIPAQLRASAYFDSPAVTTDMEAKDGSAMNALDDILDAGASAPVGAFTDHPYAGKLGPEVYGVVTKKSVASSPSLNPPSSENGVKKRSSWMPLGRRSHSRNSQDSPKLNSYASSPHLTGDGDSDHVIRVPAGPLEHNDGHAEGEEQEGEEEEELIEDYVGAPSTLLAELQLRKQQQKDRIQNKVLAAHGTQATLLELDAVAETQRIDRKSKRVNLLWEDSDAHLDQNGSDDEDVPLAIIAARQQGAKNMADLERPIGLIEKREIEENEPLSRRRARLQGLDNSFATPRPQSMLMAPARLGDTRPRQSMISLNLLPPEDVEGESLADRRKRLASEAEKENELSLPPTRPVSAAFSAELLSQFDPLEAGGLEGAADGKDKKEANGAPEEEETLGQRRRRLQAEKAARQQEMAQGGAAVSSAGHNKDRRMSLATVLSAHPRRSPDMRVQEEMQRREVEERLARENEAKMASLRLQMPSTLSVPGVVSNRGFHNGTYNNGYGGHVNNQRPVSAQVLGHGQLNRPNSMVFNNRPQQGVYMNPYAANSAQAFGGVNVYNNGVNGVYGVPQRNNQMQMPNGGSMDRVEVWRQSVFP
ncbi:hypothetical protein LMH87_003876 [Akanthomyces muscarius]|uniref:Uncharacterized protein n=1 Tax=Akanthomyces muscarius TaxID=2231603 RepID=A0A9W8Q4A9_AKAMU|nr:hypothetical protein LMH87_003876 [Akanthomyces muscarius]KAJ4145014.1 hypothetical protein LMH87_003876 [Akanthomyces muscarius]